jgi:hypothetical protein
VVVEDDVVVDDDVVEVDMGVVVVVDVDVGVVVVVVEEELLDVEVGVVVVVEDELLDDEENEEVVVEDPFGANVTSPLSQRTPAFCVAVRVRGPPAVVCCSANAGTQDDARAAVVQPVPGEMVWFTL